MMKMKRKLCFFILAACMIFACAIPGKGVHAASKAAVNSKVHSIYAKRMRQIINSDLNTHAVKYKFMDLTGDGIHEAIMYYHRGTNNNRNDLDIYAVRKGKLVRIHKTYLYGLSKIYYYNKTNSLIFNYAGNQLEGYNYCKLQKGKYDIQAMRVRTSVKGGAKKNGPWAYFNAKGVITPAKFKKVYTSMQKGKKVIFSWKALKLYK